MLVNPPCFPCLERCSIARGLSTTVLTSLVAAAGKIPDHHHGARHSICCANGRGGGVLMGGGVVNIVNGNCGLCAGGVFFFTQE